MTGKWSFLPSFKYEPIPEAILHGEFYQLDSVKIYMKEQKLIIEKKFFELFLAWAKVIAFQGIWEMQGNFWVSMKLFIGYRFFITPLIWD